MLGKYVRFSPMDKDFEQNKFRLAIDVVNDSLVETLSARSWPPRSMSNEYANNMLDKFDKNGWDTSDISFNPPASMFHYSVQ